VENKDDNPAPDGSLISPFFKFQQEALILLAGDVFTTRGNKIRSSSTFHISLWKQPGRA